TGGSAKVVVCVRLLKSELPAELNAYTLYVYVELCASPVFVYEVISDDTLSISTKGLVLNESPSFLSILNPVSSSELSTQFNSTEKVSANAVRLEGAEGVVIIPCENSIKSKNKII